MSTKKTKPHSSKKAKGTAKKGGSKKGKKGLKGTSEASNKLAVVKKSFGAAIAKPAGFATGFGLASLAAWGIDKIKILQLDTTVPADKFQFKSLVKPVLLAAAGITTTMLTSSSKKPEMVFVNGLGWGFAFAGTFNLVKVVSKIMKKDPFSGLGDAGAETAKALATADFYRAKANDTAALLEANKHLIQLPELSNKDKGVEGIITAEEEEQRKEQTLIYGMNPM